MSTSRPLQVGDRRPRLNVDIRAANRFVREAVGRHADAAERHSVIDKPQDEILSANSATPPTDRCGNE